MAGTHEDLSRELEVDPSSNKGFGLVFAGAFALLTVWPLVHRKPLRLWAIPLALVFLALALARPAWLAPLNAVWTQIGRLLQKIVHPVVMGAMFYLIFTPAGLLLRWLGNDLLHLKYDPEASTYWIPRVPSGPDGASMSRQF